MKFHIDTPLTTTLDAQVLFKKVELNNEVGDQYYVSLDRRVWAFQN